MCSISILDIMEQELLHIYCLLHDALPTAFVLLFLLALSDTP